MKNAVSVPYLMLILFPLISCVRNVPETAVQESPESPVISNDISNNRVTAFAEDAHGHIWIGTFRGLNKSTVHEYHQYFCTGDTLSIPDNQVQALYRDSGGRLWVATVNGVCRYTDKDNFRRMNLDSDNNNVVQFLEDKSGRLFVTNAESLYMWNEQSGRFSPVISRLDNERMFYCRCFMGSADDIWVVNSSEIRCYGGNPIQLKMSVKLRNPEPYASFMADGKLWLCSYYRIEVFDTGTRRYVDSPFASHPVLGNAYISLIYSLGNGTLLVNTGNDGLYCYNGNTGSICGQNDAGFPFSAPSFKINTVFKDSEDNIWLGSYDQAFSVIYNYKERFNSDSFLRSAFEDVSVYSTDCDSSGNLWITTLRGELYVYGPGGLKKMDSFPGIRIVCAGTGDDHVWLATFGSVIHCRYVSGSLHKLAEFPVPMPISLSLGEDGTLWVGAMGGTVYAVREGKVSASAPVSPSYTFVSDILPLEDGKMLAAAFREGLLEFMPDASGFSEAGIHEDDWDACIRRSVFVPTCLFRDSYGDIWVGTVANGLLRYSPSSGKMAPVPGAPCTDICSIEEDFHGNLWVSTQYGLGKYDRSVEKFINWHTADGIGGNQFYDRSSCRLPDGTIVFGGTHGLTVFNPVDVMPERDLSVCFENLKVHNVLVRPSPGGCIDRSMPHNPDVCLDYRQNSFSISFTALEYGEYERVGYFYMMEGFDNYWIDAGNNREACYANLPPGKYRFKVRITDNDRNAVLAENSVHVRVRPPLWLSWWALSSYVFFIGMIAWGLLRMRRQVLEEKKAREKEVLEKMQEKKVNEMNMSFFANISHEFRTPLTMISGPVAQLRGSDSICVEDKRLLDIVQRNIKRMLRLVNQLLDFNKLENDTLKLHVRLLDIIPQLRELAEIFRVTAQEKEIVFKAYGLEDSLTVWADDDKLDKICFNLLSNAMKFTSSGGKVELSLDVISREDAMAYFSLGDSDIDCRYVKIAVRDSGPGIPADQRERIFERYYQLENQVRGAYNWGTGIGLYFAKMLAIMHHGHIKAEGRDGMPGAEFILLLPASEISYSVDEKVPQGGAENKCVHGNGCIQYTKPRHESRAHSVLVVDDDADVFHWLNELLSPYYEVTSRFDADSAYVFMKEEAPDIVLSDVVMPGKTGYDLCRQIKDDIQLSHIPVVLLTAKATVENQVEGLECGADSYVTKPFEPKYLIALIDSLLRNREKIKAMLGSTTDTDALEADVLSPQDNAFMTELYQLMEKELSNSELDVARMTELLHMSRTKFYYKVKGLTGENPSVFFRRYKLNRAAQLLAERKYNVSEIADMTGFSTLSHFSVSFKKQFGVSPSEYVK